MLKYAFLSFTYIIVIIMINTMVSEILKIILTLILSSAYFYLTELLLILIISPIILLIITFDPSMPNKTKILVLCFNIIYSSLLLSIIQNYEMVLNNMHMTSYFSIFSPILTEIYGNIGAFIVIYVIMSILMIILYIFNVIPNLKEYINNNKRFLRFFLISFLISPVLGFLLLWLISATNSIKPISGFFLCMLLTITIVSYYPTRRKIREINIKNVKDLSEVLFAWSSLLELAFLITKENIVYILKSFPMSYELILYIITSLIIFFIALTVYLYIYTDDTHKNIIKWYILASYSSILLPVYLIAKGSILYIMRDQSGIIIIMVGLLILAIFLSIFFHFHSNVMKNINKKISNDFWDNLLSVYAILSSVISLFIEELLFYMAIVYEILIIILLLIAIKYINKNDNHDKNNSMPEK
jgi:hypothetical protein